MQVELYEKWQGGDIHTKKLFWHCSSGAKKTMLRKPNFVSEKTTLCKIIFSLLDIFPTILDWHNVSLPNNSKQTTWTGKSLMPFLGKNNDYMPLR